MNSITNENSININQTQTANDYKEYFYKKFINLFDEFINYCLNNK